MKTYEKAELEVVDFKFYDIITASGGNGENDNGIGEDDGENDGEWI